MIEAITAMLPLLIPVIALLIGLAVIGGIFFVHPLVDAITRLTDAQDGRQSKSVDASKIEQRLARLEETLERLVEEREFDRRLRAAAADADPAAREEVRVPND